MNVAHQIDIVRYRARASMASEARKTYLNFLWWIIDPLLTMAVFYLVFSVVLQRGGPDFPIFLIVGLVAWQWFGNTVGSAANSISGSGSLISQVNFSKLVLPLTIILINSYKFALVFCVMILLLWVAGYPPSVHYVALVPLILLHVLLIYGASALVATVVPIVPDLNYVISNLMRAMMFLSGIFYSIETIPESIRSYFLLNPMVSIIHSYRQILIYEQWPSLDYLSYAIVATLVLAPLSTLMLRSLEPQFARLIVQR